MTARPRPLRAFVLLLTVLAACASAHAPAAPALPAPDAGFAALIERLSEPGGFFPSDNLVSNETSYLHVLGRMAALGAAGGAYVGVGPDQNFSYIADVRPEIAFIIDIRRDNLIEHLLFKALFHEARTRIEYLCLLLGRPVPDDLEPWRNADLAAILAHVDSLPASAGAYADSKARAGAAVAGFGLPLTQDDLAALARIHEAFHASGLDIRYSDSPRHPRWRRLLLETDLTGVRRNYLASEQSFQFIKELERRNRIVPVVGDLAGPHALAAIGEEVRRRGLRVSAFYVSNVEQYLMRGGSFPEFAGTVTGLPYDEHSVIIRSYFGRGGLHPQHVPGHASTQLLERFATFVAVARSGGYTSYADLVTRNSLPLRP